MAPAGPALLWQVKRQRSIVLSISYDIVTQQHGGTIEVDSRVGEFTEFTIRLPRAVAIGAPAISSWTGLAS